MAREFARPFYQSQAWRNARAAYVKEKRGLCERCLAKGIYKAGVIVHHKIVLTPENIHDEAVLLDHENLELLCRDHHAEAHEEIYRSRTGRRYKFDELGRVIAV